MKIEEASGKEVRIDYSCYHLGQVVHYIPDGWFHLQGFDLAKCWVIDSTTEISIGAIGHVLRGGVRINLVCNNYTSTIKLYLMMIISIIVFLH